jgi:amino acid transporter
MAQESVAQESSHTKQGDEQGHKGQMLGPILCWAVVFADIGTSVYYTPGILYGTVGRLAGFFVFLTMVVFILLTLKYAEVTQRFPQGGGVVTVAAQAINHWVGALGGMFILVDYFLTAAISSLSGMLYLSVVIPSMGPFALEITITVLILLGILNWVGVSESAKVSLVGAVIAFVSDVAILVTVFSHISLPEFFTLFGSMFAHNALTPVTILTGFAGSFLAFSGLESISQLSPVMRTPRKRTAGIALTFVVLTVGLTSPLLTILSTLLLPKNVLDDPFLSGQVISLLAGKWGGIVLQTEVAISASALLVFASNTAIIGSYHVFLALSRMGFFPEFILKRNKLRGTPHYSIALVTFIPIAVLILVRGNINILGDMYAFGLLGAFTLTSLGMDIIRRRERKLAKEIASHLPATNSNAQASAEDILNRARTLSHEYTHTRGTEAPGGVEPDAVAILAAPAHSWRTTLRRIWFTLDFWLGILTTVLVATAWCTNLVAKPLATAFGGTVAGAGMLVAYVNYSRHKQAGRLPVVTTGIEGRLPGSIMAVLTADNGQNDAVIRTAVNEADGHPVVFLYLGKPRPDRTPSMFEVYDPYLYDQQAKEYFGKAEHLAQRSKIQRRFVYRQEGPGSVANIWQVVHPHDTIVAAKNTSKIEDINPDRIRYEITPNGKVAHLLKSW